MLFPIDFFYQEILGFFSSKNILILVGETGSGKTTKLPLFLNFSGLRKKKSICCIQPRRLSAISVSKKISNEISVPVGCEVGYSVRFEDCTSQKTEIKFITEGILLKEMVRNPLLDEYSILILDEIHERSFNIELILTLCKNLIRIRSDLKLIMMSATLDSERFSQFFQNCPIFCIPGKCFSVKIKYQRIDNTNYISGCFNSIIKIIKKEPKGDILVFLPGEKEIDILGNLLHFSKKKKKKWTNFKLIPIFSLLPLKFQLYATEKFYSKRKIILSTNISETSLTISGISFVVDSGLIKKKIFNSFSFFQKLIIIPTSRSSSIQRAGRAGRISEGNCFRIFTKWSYQNEMKDFFTPEIQRADCTQILLYLKNIGVKNLLGIEWIDFPSKICFSRALKTLYCLSALDKKANLTISGRKMLELPLHPMLAKAMIKCTEKGSLSDFLPIATIILSSFPFNNFLRIKKRFLKKNFIAGDHYFFLFIFNAWKRKFYSEDFLKYFGLDKDFARIFFNIKNQLLKTAYKIFWKVKKEPKKELFLKSFLSGFFLNISRLKKKKIYELLFREKFFFANIHPNSTLYNSKNLPIIVFFGEVINTNYPFIKTISGIKKKWLLDFL